MTSGRHISYCTLIILACFAAMSAQTGKQAAPAKQKPVPALSAQEIFKRVSPSVMVVESLDAQGDPEQVLYEFAAPLEDSSLRWMRWHDGVYVPWSPPAAGHTDKLAAVRGIF